MRVLLIYPNIVESPKDISIGLGLIAAVLKNAGHKVELIDTTFGLSDDKIVKQANQFKPELIGITTATNDYEYAKHIASLLKPLEVPILAAGYHPTIDPDEVIKSGYFNMICVGEGEEAILELTNALEQGKSGHWIKNIWFANHGAIIRNNPRELIQDLDSLPFADREIYNYKKYLKWNRDTATFLTTRGCPYRCSYCINHFLMKLYDKKGKFVRFRSVDNILDEIEEVKEKYKMKAIEFYDDTFTLDKNRIKEFCEKYPKRIDLPFFINGRVNAVNREMFKQLNNAGCARVSIGIESGDEYIRNKILKRDMSDAQIINTFNWAREVGLKTYSFNMVGIPFETKESIKKTIKLNRKVQPNYVGVSIFNAFKGTEIYNLCEEKGLLMDKAAKSYFKQSNIIHPNFTQDELRKIRDSFGYKVFKTYNKKRAYVDLIDRKMANAPYYTWVRSKVAARVRTKHK